MYQTSVPSSTSKASRCASGPGLAEQVADRGPPLVLARIHRGAELIFDYAAQSDDEALLTVVRTGQQHFAEIIRDYLKRITYANDGWAERLRLPAYARAEVTVDPHQAFGQPLVVHGGARVEDLVDRFQGRRRHRGDRRRLRRSRQGGGGRDPGLPSASPPEFFIDRSLGRHVVPDALRAAGAIVHVMADVYGQRIGQGLPDEEWLLDAGERELVVLMKDAKIRYRRRSLRGRRPASRPPSARGHGARARLRRRDPRSAHRPPGSR